MATPQASWPPYTAGRDCSLGFCSVYCPQWCFFYFPPPPPPPSHTDFTLSPLLIAIIVVITSAFFIVTSYLIALKFCHNRRHRRSTTSLSSTSPSTWLPPSSAGLDASLINKLAIYRYRRGDGHVVNGDSDCSVCLGEFRDGDSLRLLPKCNHAFHKSCIDTWLSSHSNCPLCRAGVMGPIEHPIFESEEEEEVAAIQDSEERDLSEERRDGDDDDDDDDDDVVIEIREEGYEVRMAGESSAAAAMALTSIKRSLSPTPENSGVDSL